MSRRAAPGRPGGPARSGPGASGGARSAPAGRHGSTRPARRRLAAADTPDAPATGGPARRVPGGLTGRAAVLGLVVCALVLSLAYPAKEFLAQRGEIGRLQAEQRQSQDRVEALERRKRQLSDPSYVTALVRERLYFVLPGETAYVVKTPAGAESPDTTPDLPAGSTDGSWYGRLWGTVRTADGASAP